jgi:cation diffusion facilitator family transporter
MHSYSLDRWQHDHNFTIIDSSNERKTTLVVALTAVTMCVEIAAGYLYGSMALLADGWHMATHVAALAIAVYAYKYAHKHSTDRRFTFGTGKVGVLGGFASAVTLAVVAVLMGIESVQRLITPMPIQFNQAILIAVVGLLVNLLSAFLLRGGHAHDARGHSEASHHHDHNLRAAYLHVLADALTSLLAIIALLAGKLYGYIWIDAWMGIVGGALIARWSWGLLSVTGHILLDSAVKQEVITSIRSGIESNRDNRISDIHVWKVATNKCSAQLICHDIALGNG